VGEIKRIRITANEHMYPSIPSCSAPDTPPPVDAFPVVFTVNNGYSCVSRLDPHAVSMLCACGSSGGCFLWMNWGKGGEQGVKEYTGHT